MRNLDEIIDEKFDRMALSAIDEMRHQLDTRDGRRKFPVVPSKLPPKALFKYLGWTDKTFESLLESVIKDRTIRYSRASTQNDPFEGKPSITKLIDRVFIEKYGSKRAIRSFLLRAFLSKPVTNPQGFLLLPFVPWLAHRANLRVPRFIEKLEGIYQNTIAEQGLQHFDFLMSCFGEEGLQPLMWAHYANAHEGIAVEYNAHDPYFRCEKFKTRLAPVRYSNKRPVLRVSPSFKIDFSRVKSNDWSYEQEWRCLPQDQNRESKHDLIFETVDKTCISAIYLGLRIKEHQKERLISEISKHLPNAKIRQVVMDADEFALRSEEIS